MSIKKLCALIASLAVTVSAGGCAGFDQTAKQRRGTTVLLVGLSAGEAEDRLATTLGCAQKTIAWSEREGSKLIMAPVGLPGQEQWQSIDFALQTSAQRTNQIAAKHWRSHQSTLAARALSAMRSHRVQDGSTDVLAAATDGSRVLNYQRGPRTLVLCTAAQQNSPELTLNSRPVSHHDIERALVRLQSELEPMRLTKVVFGAAGDSSQSEQSLTEQGAYEAFWRAWAEHQGAIHFSYGPIPHFPS